MDAREFQKDSTDLPKHELLDELMREYGSEMKRIAFLYVNDQAECEDIVQEVFISCFKNLSRFRHEAEYKTWLTRITINKCRDHQRRWSFRNLVYKPSIRPAQTIPSAEKQALDGFGSAELARFLSQLSPKFKDVLILYYFQELKMNEIADVLEISINTVKSRLLRGKQALHNVLERSERHG